MDNYLSYRWPKDPPEGPRPCPQQRHPRLRLTLIVVVAASVLAAVVVAGLALTRRMLRNMDQRWDTGEVPTVSYTAPAESDGLPEQAEGSPEVTMERAEVGLGVTLELDDTLTRTLPAREIYDQVLPAVVSVQSRSETGYGIGSGIIMREDGYILTNYHLIEGAAEAAVMTLEDGDSCAAKLVGYDAELDLAVLKIQRRGLTAARFGDSDALRVGDVAYAIGNPMGYLYGTMTDGIISYLDRSQNIGGTEMTLIQTSAVLNSGNSGGALVNERGQVVGITVAKLSGGSTASAPQVEGLGFAIPITAARPFINRILDAGESWRPVIGILCSPWAEGGRTGILIQSVTEGGPAEDAGMLAGDVLLTANGHPLDTVYSLKRVLNDAGVGGEVSCTVLRDGGELTLTAVLADGAEQAEP